MLCKNEVFLLVSTKNAVFQLLLVSSYFSLKFCNKNISHRIYISTDFIGLMKCWNAFLALDQVFTSLLAQSSFYFITFLWLDAITGVTLAAERPLCTGKSGVNFMHGPLEFRRYSGQGGSRSCLKFVNDSSTHVLELCLFYQSFAAKHQHRIDSPF